MCFRDDQVRRAGRGAGHGRVSVGTGGAWYKRDVAVADLIISHAGAGSIMDGLALKKKLVVVVNTALMDNHQAELAEAMADQKNCLQTTVQGLQSVLEAGDWDDLQPYPEPDEQAFPDLVDAVMGVAEASKEQ
ncbi:hypothetical protein PI125_g5806 [Phytophthora idaei]|nr:hypothetical protein PI125_g5806 [Phytophthora idaei]